MKAFLLILTLCASLSAFAQFNKKNKTAKPSKSASDLPLSERIYFGGGGGFNAGTDGYGNKYSSISVSPLIGYRLTMPWSIGLQVMYQNVRYSQLGITYNQYGLAPFTQYRFGQLFAHAEYQAISAPNINRDGRGIYSRLPLGLGLTQPIGSRAAINIVAAYDVLWRPNSLTSPFASPFVFRVYISAGGISF